MDLKGSLVDTTLKIYPSKSFIAYIDGLVFEESIPLNIFKLCSSHSNRVNILNEIPDEFRNVSLDTNKEEMSMLKIIKQKLSIGTDPSQKINEKEAKASEDNETQKHEKSEVYLTVTDLQWLAIYLHKTRNDSSKGKVYLHELLEGSRVEVPENKILKRNPDLEARCVKLRSQQEAREYRKMTKSVDNVRIRFPEDTIAYQLKQMNRQLIAVGQFIISIFAGFLFGFRGVELMIGNLDFGFRLLLGVMCALIITLAEIYFLAKKLNEEATIMETVQLGGPAKFVNEPRVDNERTDISKKVIKEHQD